jgi:hypothetical protein
MRVPRRPVVGLVLVGGLIGAGVAVKAPSGYAARNTSLVVSPDQGSANTPLTVTYRWPSTTATRRPTTHACRPEQITFEWDGSLLGRATATSTGNACVAVLRASPPPGTRQGAHTITVDTDSSLRATYTYAVTASPSSAATPSSLTPESTTDAAIDPLATGSQDALATGSEGALATGSEGALAPVPYTTSQAGIADGRQGGDGASAWYIALGVILFLAGASAFRAVLWRTRRAKADADVVWLPTIGNTQPLPLRTRRVWRPAHRRSG